MARGATPAGLGRSAKILFGALLIASTALGDDAGLARCRAISDPAARLACYDALTPPGGETRTTPETKGAPAAAPSGAVQPAPQPPAGQFGLEDRVAPKKGPEQMESRVKGRFEGWWPTAIIELANGQVWQVTDSGSRFYDLDSPKVTITRGVFGAFYLSVEGENWTARVQRVR